MNINYFYSLSFLATVYAHQPHSCIQSTGHSRVKPTLY